MIKIASYLHSLFYPSFCFWIMTSVFSGLPWWLRDKESACSAGDSRRLRSKPWIGTIPWRRAWQPTPIFLPGKSHGHRSLAGYGPWDRKEFQTWLKRLSTLHSFSLLPPSLLLPLWLVQKSQSLPRTKEISWSLTWTQAGSSSHLFSSGKCAFLDISPACLEWVNGQEGCCYVSKQDTVESSDSWGKSVFDFHVLSS